MLIPLAQDLVKKSNTPDREIAVAIIENEIGEIGIDDLVIRAAGYTVKNLFGGCACCTLTGQLIDSIHSIQTDLPPEWLIIEATEIAYPNGIRTEIKELIGLESIIVSIIDAKRWTRLITALEHVIIGQLEKANAILINPVIDDVISGARSYNITASVYPVSAQKGLHVDLLRKVIC